MIFEVGNLYHIYNQGNNGQKTFFSNDNYLYFLTKIKDHILPHADILAWCLMPNHFHLMVYVHTVEILVQNTQSDSMTIESDSMTQSHTIIAPSTRKIRTFNNSIGSLLRSYTRAINLQQKKSGSLFKQHTKAECITKMEGFTPSFFNTLHGTVINRQLIEKEYPQVCFDYIHNNPVKAGLVTKPEEWIYSSCCDFKGLRNGKLINKQRVEEFGIEF
ncbi:MAG: transposase [Paludibacter sp.]